MDITGMRFDYGGNIKRMLLRASDGATRLEVGDKRAILYVDEREWPHFIGNNMARMDDLGLEMGLDSRNLPMEYHLLEGMLRAVVNNVGIRCELRFGDRYDIDVYSEGRARFTLDSHEISDLLVDFPELAEENSPLSSLRRLAGFCTDHWRECDSMLTLLLVVAVYLDDIAPDVPLYRSRRGIMGS